jgi:hypothetical protein
MGVFGRVGSVQKGDGISGIPDPDPGILLGLENRVSLFSLAKLLILRS